MPAWVVRRWVQILSKDYPTLAFHASLHNAFGKGSLINLLRQYAKLHQVSASSSSIILPLYTPSPSPLVSSHSDAVADQHVTHAFLTHRRAGQEADLGGRGRLPQRRQELHHQHPAEQEGLQGRAHPRRDQGTLQSLPLAYFEARKADNLGAVRDGWYLNRCGSTSPS